MCLPCGYAARTPRLHIGGENYELGIMNYELGTGSPQSRPPDLGGVDFVDKVENQVGRGAWPFWPAECMLKPCSHDQ